MSRQALEWVSGSPGGNFKFLRIKSNICNERLNIDRKIRTSGTFAYRVPLDNTVKIREQPTALEEFQEQGRGTYTNGGVFVFWNFFRVRAAHHWKMRNKKMESARCGLQTTHPYFAGAGGTTL